MLSSPSSTATRILRSSSSSAMSAVDWFVKLWDHKKVQERISITKKSDSYHMWICDICVYLYNFFFFFLIFPRVLILRWLYIEHSMDCVLNLLAVSGFGLSGFLYFNTVGLCYPTMLDNCHNSGMQMVRRNWTCQFQPLLLSPHFHLPIQTSPQNSKPQYNNYAFPCLHVMLCKTCFGTCRMINIILTCVLSCKRLVWPIYSFNICKLVTKF